MYLSFDRVKKVAGLNKSGDKFMRSVGNLLKRM